MTIWIIIGSLVGLVAIFLVVMSIKDRKKAKKEQIEVKELEKQKEESRENVLIYLNEVILDNEKLLKSFIPSVGKIKMGDIKTKARKQLSFYKKENAYKLAMESEKNLKIIEVFESFIKENSNIWSKKFKKEIDDIETEIKNMDKSFVDKYKKTCHEIMKKAIK